MDLDPRVWDAFVLQHGPRSGRFLQSTKWRSQFVRPVVHVVKNDQDEIVLLAQGETYSISPFGSYVYFPKGPIVARMSDLLQMPNGSEQTFLRVEPMELPTGIAHLRPSISVQPSHTLITDLGQTEEMLLANMHEKTRYNIRLAKKKGVEIEIGSKLFDEAWSVFEMTSSRDHFRLHTKEHYRRLVESGVAFLAVAKWEEQILAANIMIDFGDTRTYLHGSSSNQHRNIMAPYLLHWELMMNAKAEGMAFYDWWGVAPVGAPEDHPWAGISRFKRGFGGEEVESPGTFDLIVKPFPYWLYTAARFMRRFFS